MASKGGGVPNKQQIGQDHRVLSNSKVYCDQKASIMEKSISHTRTQSCPNNDE